MFMKFQPLIRVDLYRTSWADRVTSSFYVDNDVQYFNVSEGVSQLHQGIELSFLVNPRRMFHTLKGFFRWRLIYEGDGIKSS